jgi:hypothetical protein
MNPAMSFPAGQASLQGEILRTNFGLRYLQLPVRLDDMSEEVIDIGGKPGNPSELRSIMVFSPPG